MGFIEWLKSNNPTLGYSWKNYLNDIINEGCIVDHTDIEVYMYIAYKAGQESVKGEK